MSRLIIFEALAVNAGSLLTPIGNPQNILLWGRSGLSFFGFIGQMLPLAAAMMLTLLALCWFCFPAKRLSYQSSDRAPSWQPKLVWSCLGLYVVFLTALEMNQALWGWRWCCWASGAGPGGDRPCRLVAVAGVYGDVY